MNIKIVENKITMPLNCLIKGQGNEIDKNNHIV